jgi:hypothetical protein
MNTNSPDRECRELTRLAQLTVGKPEANVPRASRVSFAAESPLTSDQCRLPRHSTRGDSKQFSGLFDRGSAHGRFSMALNIDSFMLLR